MNLQSILLTALLFTMSRPVSLAADLYVSGKGDDANPGTSAEQPLLTLQKADSLVKPGDTVWIMAGIYRNNGSNDILTCTTSGTPDAWITWKAYKDHKPELVAQGCWNAINLNASYLVFDGLTLTGNNDNVRQSDAEANGQIDVPNTLKAWQAEGAMDKLVDASATPNRDGPARTTAPRRKSRPKTYQAASPLYNGSGINVDCRGGKTLYHHFMMRNLVVRKFGTCGIAMIATDYYTIENCEVYDNAWYNRYGGSGISQLGGRAVDQQPGYHITIRNNRVWNNKCLVRVFYLDLYSDGNGIILDSLGNYPGSILVENNLVYNNGGGGIHVFKSRRAKIDITHNTVWRNQQMWQIYDLGAHAAVNVRFLNNIVVADRYRQVNGKPDEGVTYDYNIYSGSDKGRIFAQGPNDLIADPMFVRAATHRIDGDFRLKSGSPAIDSAGSELTPRTDLDGKPRPFGVRPDRGAYEWNP
jgi:hypothetical protein